MNTLKKIATKCFLLCIIGTGLFISCNTVSGNVKAESKNEPKQIEGTIPVTFAVKEGCETVFLLRGRYRGRESWADFESGEKLNPGMNIVIVPELEEGFACNWYVNGKLDQRVIKEYRYTLTAADETAGGISIEAELVPLKQIIVNLQVEGKGTVKAEAENYESRVTIQSGAKVYQNTCISITATPEEGYIKECFINDEDWTDHMDDNGSIWIIAGDAVENGVINFKIKFHKPETYTVNFVTEGPGRIEPCVCGDSNVLKLGTQVPEKTELFIHSLPDAGYYVDWYINGKDYNQYNTGSFKMGSKVGNLFLKSIKNDMTKNGIITVKAIFRKAKSYKVFFRLADALKKKEQYKHHMTYREQTSLFL